MYDTPISQTATEPLSERLIIFFKSELLIIFVLPPVSLRLIVRMPMLSTVPRNPFTSIMSPTLNWFSKRIKIPVTTSATRLSAPKPRTRATIPRLAKIVLTLTPISVSTQQKPTITIAYFTRLATTAPIVPTRPVFPRNKPKSNCNTAFMANNNAITIIILSKIVPLKCTVPATSLKFLKTSILNPTDIPTISRTTAIPRLIKRPATLLFFIKTRPFLYRFI